MVSWELVKRDDVTRKVVKVVGEVSENKGVVEEEVLGRIVATLGLSMGSGKGLGGRQPI